MLNPAVIRAARKSRKIVASIIFIFSGTFGSSPAFGQDSGQILARAHWDAGNKHEFVYVSLSNSTWEEAQNDLSDLFPGFLLATITSQAEHDFLIQLLDEVPSFSQGWLGGFQDPPDEPDPSTGWTWITGEAWSYTNWHDAEPNDGGGCLCENHLAIDFHRQSNDEGTAIGTISGYFAESSDPIFMDGFESPPNTCPCWEESELQAITAANIAFPGFISCGSSNYPNYLGIADVDETIAFEAVSNPDGSSGPVLSCGAYDNTPYWQDTTMAEADICIAQLARRCADIGHPVVGN